MTQNSTIKEQKFVEHYAAHGNATQAAIYAGYSKNGADRAGYRLLQSKSVQKELAGVKKELAEKSLWTRERAIKELEAIIEKSKTQEQDKPKHSDAIKAIEDICKLADLFPSEKKELEINGELGMGIKQARTFADLKNEAGSD